MTKRTIHFYEVAPNPRLPEMTECEGRVFDVINDEGAATLRVIVRKLPDYSPLKISSTLGKLVSAGAIIRRTMSAEEGD